jgi:hypothetical protein
MELSCTFAFVSKPFKEETLDRTVWKTRYGRGYRLVVRQTTDDDDDDDSGRAFSNLLSYKFDIIHIHLYSPEKSASIVYCKILRSLNIYVTV